LPASGSGERWYIRPVEGSRFLIEILLPTTTNDGEPFGDEVFASTRAELTERFGGLTAHLRAPARGLWKTDQGAVSRDDIVIFEVMCESLDRPWWREYRKLLESRFQQDVIVIRATTFTPL
jgi:hypothetical protein